MSLELDEMRAYAAAQTMKMAGLEAENERLRETVFKVGQTYIDDTLRDLGHLTRTRKALEHIRDSNPDWANYGTNDICAMIEDFKEVAWQALETK